MLGFFMLLSYWILLTYWRTLSGIEMCFSGFALSSWRKLKSWAAVAVVMLRNTRDWLHLPLQSIRHGNMLR